MKLDNECLATHVVAGKRNCFTVAPCWGAGFWQLAGALGTGGSRRRPVREAEPFDGARLEFSCRATHCPPIRCPQHSKKNVVRLIDNPDSQPANFARPHTASTAQRHHHAERAALQREPWRRFPPSIQRGTGFLIHGLVKTATRLHGGKALIAVSHGVSRINFLECGGNKRIAVLQSARTGEPSSRSTASPLARTGTGVPARRAAGRGGCPIRGPSGFISEGADAPHLTRSVPLGKAFDDAIVALYQNGERLMPGNGYPMRPVPARMGREHEHQNISGASALRTSRR